MDQNKLRVELRDFRNISTVIGSAHHATFHEASSLLSFSTVKWKYRLNLTWVIFYNRIIISVHLLENFFLLLQTSRDIWIQLIWITPSFSDRNCCAVITNCLMNLSNFHTKYTGVFVISADIYHRWLCNGILKDISWRISLKETVKACNSRLLACNYRNYFIVSLAFV